LKKKSKKRRQLEARSFNDADVSMLIETVDKDVSPEGRVLQVILDTGLRVGDVLRLPRIDIKRGLRSGVLRAVTKGDVITQIPIAGATEAWQRLYDEMKGHRTVAQWVCPDGDGSARAGDCAYQRVNRHLKGLGEKLGLEGRVHLHRIRRTFAVAALRHTEDVVAVQQALGHRSLQATQQYLDELRVDDVADLQKAIRKNRKKRK
jgi:integrase/recombinase XerC